MRESIYWALAVLGISLMGGLLFQNVVPVQPLYASEIADKTIAEMNAAAPKFPRKPMLSADVKVLLDRGHGSAVHIGGGLFLTAAHVVEKPSKRLDLRFGDSSTRKAEVLWTSKERDIALLRASGTDVDAAALSCVNPKIGDDVTLVGNPLALDDITAFGRIAGKEREIGHWKSVMVVSAPTMPGQSGGAVYNAQGEVTGITVGLALWPQGFVGLTTGYGFIVPGKTICQLLARD